MIKILPQVVLGLWGIMPGNYSGISHVCDNVYAIVDDKDMVDGFKLLTLDIDSVDGKVNYARLQEPTGMTVRRAMGTKTDRDCEGVAYFPDRNTVFVSGETDQRILEYDINGSPTGRELPIPACMQRDRIVQNRGFEALTYNARQQRFWTTTESVLPADVVEQSANQRLRFISYDNMLNLGQSYVYEMDKAKGTRAKANKVHGVPSLLALDDGRLIVMEREAFSPRSIYGSWVKIKLYVVDPTREQPVSLDTPMADVPTEMNMKKELLCSFTTHLRLGRFNISNYEGMCLGPRLADGRQTLILIADSQNGMGNKLYHVKDHIRLVVISQQDIYGGSE